LAPGLTSARSCAIGPGWCKPLTFAKLDEAERTRLVEALAASLYGRDLGHDWEEEIQRRIDDIDSGRVEPIPSGKLGYGNTNSIGDDETPAAAGNVIVLP
jgi:hypothetical protein